MAIPTIVSLDPDNGLTRGDNIVRIVGTNFPLPIILSTGYLGGDQQKTVSVKFEGQESEWAYAASPELIMARVPEYRGPHDISYPVALDVRVANLDSNGDEIPTENVTLAEGYSVNRPGLSGQSYFQSVVRAFIHLFKRHVLPNVFSTNSRDSASDPSEGDARARASAPSITLVGPRATQDRIHNYDRLEEQEDPGDVDSFIRRRHPTSVDFSFGLVIYAVGSGHLFSLQQSCINLFRDITHIRVPVDDAAPDGDYTEYEISMPWLFEPDTEDDPNSSDLFVARAGVMIHGVQVDSRDGTIVQRGWRITANDGNPSLEVEVLADE